MTHRFVRSLIPLLLSFPALAADQVVRRVRAHVCRWQEGLTAAPE